VRRGIVCPCCRRIVSPKQWSEVAERCRYCVDAECGETCELDTPRRALAVGDE